MLVFLLTSQADLQHSGHHLEGLLIAHQLHAEKLLCLIQVQELMRGKQLLFDVIVDGLGGGASTRFTTRRRKL
jgi:hypothetical protein